MRLIPAAYRCGDDGENLTDLVHDELELRSPASFARRQEFRVIVRCPGRGKPHDVGVTGQYVGR